MGTAAVEEEASAAVGEVAADSGAADLPAVIAAVATEGAIVVDTAAVIAVVMADTAIAADMAGAATAGAVGDLDLDLGGRDITATVTGIRIGAGITILIITTMATQRRRTRLTLLQQSTRMRLRRFHSVLTIERRITI